MQHAGVALIGSHVHSISKGYSTRVDVAPVEAVQLQTHTLLYGALSCHVSPNECDPSVVSPCRNVFMAPAHKGKHVSMARLYSGDVNLMPITAVVNALSSWEERLAVYATSCQTPHHVTLNKQVQGLS